MAELLENSDNTNVDTGVSESPANEATISLAAVQALADALQKIEAYTPTVWVDNESPDIDAAHLNKAEQAIMRVTTAMNSAVDVIKDLQSQVNTTNNNLSKRFSSDSFVYSSIDDIPKSGSCFGTISKSIKIGDVTIPAYSRFSFMNTGNSSDGALFAIDSNGYSYTAYRTSGVWNKCFATATKSDLTDKAKKISQNFQPGSTILNVSSWSAITLLSLVTYKNETTSLYLIRKETSTNIYCIPIKSSTQVSVSYSGENMLTLTDSATYGGTWSVLFLS